MPEAVEYAFVDQNSVSGNKVRLALRVDIAARLCGSQLAHENRRCNGEQKSRRGLEHHNVLIDVLLQAGRADDDGQDERGMQR